ncbi:hypothetical protein HII31_04494 [Pseudocercospora fuligena]|uniref:Transcription factor domain-containing protein n=1 Tax=Pseudocercospora fuligena TaxID=685502 RepID=A0A8H6RP64_9PEZI|nr:hypothetical protein HII31_04494 [Pseudocercospora fuligena]
MDTLGVFATLDRSPSAVTWFGVINHLLHLIPRSFHAQYQTNRDRYSGLYAQYALNNMYQWRLELRQAARTPSRADVTCNRDANEKPDSFANDHQRVPTMENQDHYSMRGNVAPDVHSGHEQTPRERWETVCYRNQLVRQAYMQSSTTVTMLATPQLSNHEIDNVYLTVLQDFQPHSGVRIFCGDRVPGPAYNADYSTAALCIRGLLPLARQSGRTFDLALCSVLTLYLGRLRSDARLIQVAKLSYADALGLFHVALGTACIDEVEARSAPNRVKILACVSIALQLYELIDQVDISSVAFEAHIEGAIELIQECGPSAFTSSAFQNIFSSFRNILAGYSIPRRRPSFLHQPDWLLMPFIGRRKSVRDRLADIAVLIPERLGETDVLVHGSGPREQSFRIEVGQQLQDIDELLRQLKSWFAHASLEYGGIAVHYDGTGSSTMQSTLSNTPSSVGSREVTSMRLLSSKAAAQEAALLALEASTWPSSTLEGIVALQFPLKTLERYFSEQEVSM